MPYIHRNLEDFFRKSGMHYPAILLTGPRQVGKTTFLRHVSEETRNYVSLDIPRDRNLAKEDPELFLERHKPPVLIDEIQYAPELLPFIKVLIDKEQKPGMFWLTGSQQFRMMQNVTESLAGRVGIFEMLGLSNRELEHRNVQPFLPTHDFPAAPEKLDLRGLYRRIWQGSFPKLADDPEMDHDLFYGSYINTYLERDVRDLASFRDLEPFVKLQHAVALQTAQALNASALAGRVGITSKTVQRYIEYLGVSYQTLLLPAWERNKNKRLTKMPKVHYLDNGVLQAVLQKRGGMTGAEFESLVVAELYKQAKNLQAPVSFYHLRTHDGKEVDLLVETAQGYYAFEIKMTDHVQPSDVRHLVALEALLDKPVLQAYVLSNDYATRSLADGVLAVNVNMFLG